ncbi:NAD(P)H-binding protein [Lentzea cavernae]|uniref:Nucleotide-diphosphate-sugar epimerase n=1 Tax=Lentzea cavernae TaxID=2020703 RepID=A0ABQ3ML56_9PSEU|nr:NAD(P)H-binding protein [Lentzea cavernae]GHH49084.1 nucleotide-diphosphate-sugar epimerase [Lentzea cavernae]
MILITGATGTVGSHLVRQLTARGEAVRALSRKPGEGLVRADFDDPASLAAAVAGVRAVFLLTAPVTPTPAHDLAMLEAARSAGVTAVVKLSAIGTGQTFEGRTVGAWHQEAERAVKASGLAWTVLRPSSFASNVLRLPRPMPNTTGTAAQGVVDPGDVAAVAAEVLTSPGHAGRTYTLTGPELLSVPEQAAIMESVLGTPVPTADVPLDAAREQMLRSGAPPAAVDAAVTGMAWARAGHNAVVTGDVPRLLGRPATDFATWVRASPLNSANRISG